MNAGIGSLIALSLVAASVVCSAAQDAASKTRMYVTTLAWAGTVTGAVALLSVDLCSL
jgi:hypothetical protein